jgi:hypothetical protein
MRQPKGWTTYLFAYVVHAFACPASPLGTCSLPVLEVEQFLYIAPVHTFDHGFIAFDGCVDNGFLALL